jgi:hypothetical protein
MYYRIDKKGRSLIGAVHSAVCRGRLDGLISHTGAGALRDCVRHCGATDMVEVHNSIGGRAWWPMDKFRFRTTGEVVPLPGFPEQPPRCDFWPTNLEFEAFSIKFARDHIGQIAYEWHPQRTSAYDAAKFIEQSVSATSLPAYSRRASGIELSGALWLLCSSAASPNSAQAL